MLNPLRIAGRAAAAIALGLALSSPGHAAPVLSMSTAASASGIDLSVSVQDVVDLYAYQFTLNFDPTLLTALGGTEGAFLPSGGSTFFHAGDIDNIAGFITFVLGTLIGPVDGVDGSGDLATFSFDVRQGGSASFSLSDVLLIDSNLADIPVEARDLVVSVPEPASLWLAATGLFAVLGGRKTRPITA